MIRLMLFGLFAIMLGVGPAAAQDEPMSMSFITPEEWQDYQDAFVRDDGRVVDTANGDISHSESQGYGLLLAVLANDRAAFERIWTFTRTELMIRDDGLAAWRWEPEADPHVTDINNATDGDILIAYALALAATAWGDAQAVEQATAIARTVGTTLLTEAQGLSIILPGAEGFAAGDREDGPVVNPSYWVFEAFPVLADLTLEIDWMDVYDDGLALIERLTSDGIPPADWVSLAGDIPAPAEGFPSEFGYNNVRIPLYLIRASLADPELLERMGMVFNENFAPTRIDVTTGRRLGVLEEAGYRMIGAARACVLDGSSIPADLREFSPQSYYGSTLHLLALSYLRQWHNGCLLDRPAQTEEAEQ